VGECFVPVRVLGSADDRVACKRRGCCVFVPSPGTYPVNGTSATKACAVPTLYTDAATASLRTVLGPIAKFTASGVRGDNSSCPLQLLYRAAGIVSRRRDIASLLCDSGYGFHVSAALELNEPLAAGDSGVDALSIAYGLVALTSNISAEAGTPAVTTGLHFVLLSGPQQSPNRVRLALINRGLTRNTTFVSDPLDLPVGVPMVLSVSVDLKRFLVSFSADVDSRVYLGSPLGEPKPFNPSDVRQAEVCSPPPSSRDDLLAVVVGGWAGWLAVPASLGAFEVKIVPATVAAFSIGPGVLPRLDLLSLSRRLAPSADLFARVNASLLPSAVSTSCAWGYYGSPCRLCPASFAGSALPRLSLRDCECAPRYVRESVDAATCEFALPALPLPTIVLNMSVNSSSALADQGALTNPTWQAALKRDTGVPLMIVEVSASGPPILVIATVASGSAGVVLLADEAPRVALRVVCDLPDALPDFSAAAVATATPKWAPDPSNQTGKVQLLTNATWPLPLRCTLFASSLGSWRRAATDYVALVSITVLPTIQALGRGHLWPTPDSASYHADTSSTQDAAAGTSVPPPSVSAAQGLFLSLVAFPLHPSLAAIHDELQRCCPASTLTAASPSSVIGATLLRWVSGAVLMAQLETRCEAFATLNDPRLQAAQRDPQAWARTSPANQSARYTRTLNASSGLQQVLPYLRGTTVAFCAVRAASPGYLLPSSYYGVTYTSDAATPTSTPTPIVPTKNTTTAAANNTSTLPPPTTGATTAPVAPPHDATKIDDPNSAIRFFAHPATIAISVVLFLALSALLALLCLRRRRLTRKERNVGSLGGDHRSPRSGDNVNESAVVAIPNRNGHSPFASVRKPEVRHPSRSSSPAPSAAHHQRAPASYWAQRSPSASVARASSSSSQQRPHVARRWRDFDEREEDEYDEPQTHVPVAPPQYPSGVVVSPRHSGTTSPRKQPREATSRSMSPAPRSLQPHPRPASPSTVIDSPRSSSTQGRLDRLDRHRPESIHLDTTTIATTTRVTSSPSPARRAAPPLTSIFASPRVAQPIAARSPTARTAESIWNTSAATR
jgi:hypothetical protein